MSHPNLADPDFEPTDEQLAELMRAAFSHLAAAKKEVDDRLKKEIAERSARVLADLATNARPK